MYSQGNHSSPHNWNKLKQLITFGTDNYKNSTTQYSILKNVGRTYKKQLHIVYTKVGDKLGFKQKYMTNCYTVNNTHVIKEVVISQKKNFYHRKADKEEVISIPLSVFH